MSNKCSAVTKRGRRCRASRIAGHQFCAFHADPKRAAELGRIGGRKNRHYVEVEDVTVTPPLTPDEVKVFLAQAMADVRSKKLDPRIASALTYMSSVLLKVIDLTDVHQRLTRIEARSQGGEEPGTFFVPKAGTT